MQSGKEFVEHIYVFYHIHCEQRIGGNSVVAAPVAEGRCVALQHHIRRCTKQRRHLSHRLQRIGIVVDVYHSCKIKLFGQNAQQTVATTIVDYGHLVGRFVAHRKCAFKAVAVNIKVILGGIEHTLQRRPAVLRYGQLVDIQLGKGVRERFLYCVGIVHILPFNSNS